MSNKIDIEAFERWVFNEPVDGIKFEPSRLLKLLDEIKPDDLIKQRLLEICNHAQQVEHDKLKADPDGRVGSAKLGYILTIKEKLKDESQSTDIKERLLLLKQLKDADYAIDYINEAIEKGDGVFLLAVRDVIEAQVGISNLSKVTALNLEDLYNMLSGESDPALFSIAIVLESLGLQLAVTKKKQNTEET